MLMDYRIEQLRYLLREDASSRIFFQLGELLRREGDAEEAVRVLQKGLERHPRYVAAWVSLGRSFRDLDSLAEAEHAFETALEIDRENPVAARLLGETAAERGDWLQAVKALKLTRALAGGDDELDAQIARVEERLDEDGRLERHEAPPPPRVSKPVRCLEVVSFSRDDPFSASPDAVEMGDVASDVFGFSEDSAQPEEDEVSEHDGPPFGDGAAVADDEVPEEPADAGPPEFDDTGDVEVGDQDEHPADPPEEPADVASDSAHPVDESSVGAWSSSTATGGVSPAQAWTEPTDELQLSDDEASIGAPWLEPTAASEPAEAPAAETVIVGESGVDEAPEAEPPPIEVLEASAAETIDDAYEGPGRRHGLEHGVPLPTMTLAKLAFQQNDRPLAMATLESLLDRDPGHVEALDMLDKLRAQDETVARAKVRAAYATAKIGALQGWLDAVRLAAERRAQ